MNFDHLGDKQAFMSHKLSNRKTGKEIEVLGKQFEAQGNSKDDAALFVVGKELAWHGLGRNVESALNSAEALEACGGDFEIKKGEIFTPDMQVIDKKIGQRIYRADNNETLGIVGDRYHIIQNKDAFAVMDEIVKDDTAKFVSAGVLGHGEAIFITAKLPENIKIAGDDIIPYFHFLNYHDGSGSAKLYSAPTRQVCANTVAFALAEAKAAKRMFNIRHTRNYEQRLEEAAKALGMIRTYAETFETFANRLLNIKFSETDFEKMMDHLMEEPEDKDTKAFTLVDRERGKLHQAHMAVDLSNVQYTAWGAYNAVADYADHMRLSRGDDQTRKVNEFLRTFSTQGSEIKDKALEYILATKG